MVNKFETVSVHTDFTFCCQLPLSTLMLMSVMVRSNIISSHIPQEGLIGTPIEETCDIVMIMLSTKCEMYGEVWKVKLNGDQFIDNLKHCARLAVPHEWNAIWNANAQTVCENTSGPSVMKNQIQ